MTLVGHAVAIVVIIAWEFQLKFIDVDEHKEHINEAGLLELLEWVERLNEVFYAILIVEIGYWEGYWPSVNVWHPNVGHGVSLTGSMIRKYKI
jgi:hypothetical protein